MAEGENKPAKQKRNLSPEGREKLRQAALKRHREGKFGGAEFGKLGGRPKKRDRAAQTVAEQAREKVNRDALVKVFKDAIAPDKPMSQRLKGAELWLSIEREEGKLALQEEAQDFQHKSKDELVAALASRLLSPQGRIVARQLEASLPINSDAEEIPDAEVVDDDAGAAA